MRDPNGDPTFRVIDRIRLLTDYMITHDYYGHSDAVKDVNIVLPLERLKEFEDEGFIGRVAERHYSFMGHIDGPYIPELINKHAKELARRLKADSVDVVLLTPG
jgi:D-proline reductase (dithiol) PrdB